MEVVSQSTRVHPPHLHVTAAENQFAKNAAVLSRRSAFATIVLMTSEPNDRRRLGKHMEASMADYNPWNPIKDPVQLKHLGKLNEELGELTAAVSRCIIQGVDEKEPVTGKVNREWLTEEIADVACNITLCVELFGLDTAAITRRVKEKEAKLRGWHADAR
jgi:NTP pyrophosphatase (non-canonical NTP hydrolase)